MCGGLLKLELLDKIAQLVPKPRKHRHHYHGVLAPNSPYRKLIVAHAGESLPEILIDSIAPTVIEKVSSVAKVKVRYLWSILLSRVYELMPLQCTNCGGEVKIIAFIKDQSSINEILSHLKLPLEAPTLSPARGHP